MRVGDAQAQGHQQIEVLLGHFCNDRCVFCVSGKLSAEKNAPPLALEPLLQTISDAREGGASKITLLGGEPTLAPTFVPVLEKAVALEFDEITIFTNGARGFHKEWIENICNIGTFTWRVSIQGSHEEAHDAVTRKKRSFFRLMAMLDELVRLKQNVTANMCISVQNFKSLAGYPELIHRYGIRQFHVDVLRPWSTGLRDDEEIRTMLPRHKDVAPYLDAMMRGFASIKDNIDVSVGNLPYCILPKWSHVIHHGGEPTLTVTTDGAGNMTQSWSKYTHQAADGVFGPDCLDCLFRTFCRGVPVRYHNLFGTDELRPIQTNDLSRTKDRTREFVVVHDALAREIARRATTHDGMRVEVWRDRRLGETTIKSWEAEKVVATIVLHLRSNQRFDEPCFTTADIGVVLYAESKDHKKFLRVIEDSLSERGYEYRSHAPTARDRRDPLINAARHIRRNGPWCGFQLRNALRGRSEGELICELVDENEQLLSIILRRTNQKRVVIERLDNTRDSEIAKQVIAAIRSK